MECVADLVGADASCSGEQAGAHERPHGEPGQPDSEGVVALPKKDQRTFSALIGGGGGGRRYAELVFEPARELLYAGVGVLGLVCGGR
jgi:hypothetical protein